MNKVFLNLLLAFFLVSTVSAVECTEHPLDTTLYFAVTSNNATQCNATTLTSEHGLDIINQVLTKDGQSFNGTLANTYLNQEGKYTLNIVCTDGVNNEGGSICRTVTLHGGEKPDGVVIVFFSIILLIILGASMWILVYSFGHLINLDFDLMDWALNWGAFFVLLGALQLEIAFLGNIGIETWLNNFITWYRYPIMIIPPIAFLLSLVMDKKKKKAEANKW